MITIIGILIALLLPAVQAAREAARRMQCSNNLKQIALALHTFENANGGLPPARYAGVAPSWFALVLPYLEGANQYALWRLDEMYIDDVNKTAREQHIAAFICPSRRTTSGLSTSERPDRPDRDKAFGACGDYAGDFGHELIFLVDPPEDISGVIYTYPGLHVGGSGAFMSGGKIVWRPNAKFSEIRDGLSNTLMVGEKHIREGGLLSYPDDTSIYNGDGLLPHVRAAGPAHPLARSAADQVNCGPDGCGNFGSWHPGVCHFGLCDGSVRPIGVEIDVETLRRLAMRNDELPLPGDF